MGCGGRIGIPKGLKTLDVAREKRGQAVGRRISRRGFCEHGQQCFRREHYFIRMKFRDFEKALYRERKGRRQRRRDVGYKTPEDGT